MMQADKADAASPSSIFKQIRAGGACSLNRGIVNAMSKLPYEMRLAMTQPFHRACNQHDEADASGRRLAQWSSDLITSENQRHAR